MELLIVGASVRAAAYSALRAGLKPLGIDLFADRDLAAVARCRQVSMTDYPEGLANLALLEPQRPWMYTGGLENAPDVIELISERHPLWGNSPEVVRAVRDPLRLARCINEAGLPAPEVRLDPSRVPTDGSWLIKPLGSAGGMGIRPWRGGRVNERHYFQKRVEGPGGSAVYVGDGAGARLLGVTRQWLGRPGEPFAYRGSLGPWRVGILARQRIATLGMRIASAFELRGVFGVDFILRNHHPWPVEVNPRYTASVEVLELAIGTPFLTLHWGIFDPDPTPVSPIGSTRHVGKAIVYARRPCRFPDKSLRIHDLAPFEVSRMADIPSPGQEFAAGDPVLTLLETGSSLKTCHTKLLRRLQSWRRWLAQR